MSSNVCVCHHTRKTITDKYGNMNDDDDDEAASTSMRTSSGEGRVNHTTNPHIVVYVINSLRNVMKSSNNGHDD